MPEASSGAARPGQGGAFAGEAIDDMPLRLSVDKNATPQEALLLCARGRHCPPPGVEVPLMARDHVISHGHGDGITGHAVEYGKSTGPVQICNEVFRLSETRLFVYF